MIEGREEVRRELPLAIPSVTTASLRLYFPPVFSNVQHVPIAVDISHRGSFLRKDVPRAVTRVRAISKSSHVFSTTCSVLQPRAFCILPINLLARAPERSIWERPAETGHRARAVPFSRKRRSV